MSPCLQVYVEHAMHLAAALGMCLSELRFIKKFAYPVTSWITKGPRW